VAIRIARLGRRQCYDVLAATVACSLRARAAGGAADAAAGEPRAPPVLYLSHQPRKPDIEQTFFDRIVAPPYNLHVRSRRRRRRRRRRRCRRCRRSPLGFRGGGTEHAARRSALSRSPAFAASATWGTARMA
jgi:hypothetical protein